MLDNMMDAFQKMPNLPDGFVERFKAEAKPEQIVDLCVPIYDKYLSEEDLDGILVFYKSPAGKHLLQAQPKILQESMEVGQKWGRELAERVLESLQCQKSKP
jgi:hypothetical protein